MRFMVRACFVATMIFGSMAAATIGQVDTFEDGTTMGWFVPGMSPNPPANSPTGGPGGAGDSYLVLTSNGGMGPGGRLAVLNDSQWTGDYLTAGIVTISMDVQNFGPSDVYLRLLLEDFAGMGPPVNLALTQAALVSAGSGWQKVSFSLRPVDLVTLFGTAEAAVANVDTLRIFHNPDPDFPGPGVGIPPIVTAIGVDNLTASGVPEPSTTVLGLSSLAFFGLRLVRSRRSN